MPKKGERLTCLGCNGVGKVWTGKKYLTCKGCHGTGYIEVQ